MANDENIFQHIRNINAAVTDAKRDVESANKALHDISKELQTLLELSRKNTTQTSLRDFDKSELSLEVLKLLIDGD
jgi:hypothetical protein